MKEKSSVQWHAAFFMGRRGELRINDNFLETKIRATPYKNIKKSRNCVKTIIVNSRIYLFNDNRDNIPLESTSSSGKEYYYQQKKRTRSDRSNDAEYTQGRSLFFCRTFEHLPWL